MDAVLAEYDSADIIGAPYGSAVRVKAPVACSVTSITQDADISTGNGLLLSAVI